MSAWAKRRMKLMLQQQQKLQEAEPETEETNDVDTKEEEEEEGDDRNDSNYEPPANDGDDSVPWAREGTLNEDDEDEDAENGQAMYGSMRDRITAAEEDDGDVFADDEAMEDNSYNYLEEEKGDARDQESELARIQLESAAKVPMEDEDSGEVADWIAGADDEPREVKQDADGDGTVEEDEEAVPTRKRKRKQRDRPDQSQRDLDVKRELDRIKRPRRQAPPEDIEQERMLREMVEVGSGRSRRARRPAGAPREVKEKPPKEPKPPKPDQFMLPGQPLTPSIWARLDSEEEATKYPTYCFLCECTRGTASLDGSPHVAGIRDFFLQNYDGMDLETLLTRTQEEYQKKARWYIENPEFRLPWHRRQIYDHFTKHTMVHALLVHDQLKDLTTIRRAIVKQINVVHPIFGTEVVDLRKAKVHIEYCKAERDCFKEYSALRPTSLI